MEGSEELNNELPQGVNCVVHIPLSWSERADAPRPGEALYMQNVQRLHAIEALEANSARKPDPASTTDAELHRLETKINLALDLLGTLLEQAVPRPEPFEVELNASSAIWTTPTAPETGKRGRLKLYLHPLLAQPIALPGQITNVETDAETGMYKVSCEFDPMPDDCTDAYNAYVFRGHRREIAQKRLQPKSANPDNNPTQD